jgi:hypothetical protein
MSRSASLNLVVFAVWILTPHVGFTGNLAPVLECPDALAIKISTEKYPGWFIYSNNPLRLTGADIAYISSNEDATLDPDEVKDLNDEDLSVVSVFRLSEHKSAKNPELVCYYGVHAQLSRRIPPVATECSVLEHRRFDEINVPQFVASCR